MGHVNSYVEEEDKGYEGSSESDVENGESDHPTYPQVQLLCCIQNKPLLILSCYH